MKKPIGINTYTGVITVGYQPKCEHRNGWYGRVNFWIFSKYVFACSDCGEFLYGKRLKEWRGIKKNKRQERFFGVPPRGGSGVPPKTCNCNKK